MTSIKGGAGVYWGYPGCLVYSVGASVDAPSSFGQILRAYRRARDLTQEELARRSFCALTTIKKIEADERRPSRELAERLAQVLEVPERDLRPFLRLARGLPADAVAPLPALAALPTLEEIGADNLTGREVRGFALRERLGIGGFGAVYRALQSTVEREVAIKIILPRFANHPDFIRRFESEARFVARLEHPYIVPLYDYWREPGSACLVMRYMRGGSLAAALNEGPLDLETVLVVLDQLGAAITVAHRAGVIHRDLKPANVLRDSEGNVYLADFGIAKDLAAPRVEGLTQSGAIVGSPDYLSPEQITDEPLTPRTDIYSLGVMLYELLTGVKPFKAQKPSELLQLHLTTPLPSLLAQRERLPVELDAVIQRATAKNPGERYPDAASLVTAFRQIVVANTSLHPSAAAIAGRARSERQTIELDLPELPNPYKGLRAFGEADAADFCGRDALVARLLERLAEDVESARFLAVVGPSGSGKSSVVRAGLIPALRRGGVPGSEHWLIADLIPSAHPHEELELALLRLASARPPDLAEQLARDERGLLRAARLLLPTSDEAELLLVIDQFEELFTLVESEATRVQFLATLVAAVTDPRSRVRVVITLRADFYDRPLRYFGLGELIRARTEVILPLNADELEQAISEPARRAGLTLEPGLVAAITRDVGAQPGTLPLLQYALTELFERRDRRRLTLAAYRDSGGVLGALARRADEIYAGLSMVEQATARQLFLRLVTPGEGVEDTRRRARLDELGAWSPEHEADRPHVEPQSSFTQVAEAFGRYRLLTFDHDPTTRIPTVEVAHEALLRSWGLLRAWIDASRDDLRTQRRLTAAAVEWLNAGQDPGFLASGARLIQFAALAEGGSLTLSAAERAYLDASLTERDQQAAAERDRQARELAQARALGEEQRRAAAAQRSAAQRLRYLVGTLALFLFAAVGLSLFALNQRGEARANFTQAEAQRLATEANTLIAEHGNIDVATLLAIRSLNTQYTPQGDKALAAALQALHPRYRVTGNTLGIRRFDISADNQRAAAINADGTVRVWNLADGAVIQTFQAHADLGADLRFLPGGDQLVTGGHDGRLVLWDLASAKPLREFNQGSYIRAVEVSPDGRLLFSGGEQDTRVHIWDATTGAEIRTVVADDVGILTMDVSRDGQLLLVGGFDKTGKLIDIQSGVVLRLFEGHTDWIYDVSFAPDGFTIMTAGPDRSARIWDVASGRELRQLSGHTQEIWDAHLSADGQLAITGAFDGTARVWEYASGRELYRLNAHYAQVSAVAISPNGRYVLTNGVDNWETALMWDLQEQPDPAPLRGHTNIVPGLAVASQSSYAATASYDTTVRFWEIAQGRLLRIFEGHGTTVNAVAISPDGRYILSGGYDRTTRLWDTRTGEGRIIARHPKAEGIVGVAFSPDGKYALSSGWYDKTAYLIDVQTGELVWELNDPGVGVAAFSPDGQQLLMLANTSCCDTSIKGGVAMFDARTGAKIQDYPIPSLHGLGKVAFAPDGTYFAISGPRNIYVWRVGEPESRRDFTGHTDAVEGIAFSADSRWLLSGSWDGTARLWDVETGSELRRLSVAGSGGVHGVAFAADGRHLLTAHDDNLVRIWHIDISETVSALCARLLRDFTADERTQYGISDTVATCPQP